MGIEYSMAFIASEPAAVDTALRQLGCSLVASPSGECFEYRNDSASLGMPDATAVLTEGGLYFCDHGGSGREFLGRLVASLVGKFGALNIREWEE
jgi:hypothetical protein